MPRRLRGEVPVLLPDPVSIRLDPDSDAAISEFRAREDCSVAEAIRRLIKRGHADWAKERRLVDAVRAGNAL